MSIAVDPVAEFLSGAEKIFRHKIRPMLWTVIFIALALDFDDGHYIVILSIEVRNSVCANFSLNAHTVGNSMSLCC